MSVHNLEHLFAPAAIAAVGRFGSGTARDRVVLDNLCRSPHERLTIVDLDGSARPDDLPPGATWAGALDALEPDTDVVLTPLPLPQLPAVAERCAALGVKGLILSSRVMGPEDQAHAAAVCRIAREGGQRLLGPNSTGLMVSATGCNLSLFERAPAPGPIALISQSGSLIATVLDSARQRGLGFSHVVSLGSLADIDFGDVIDYLAWESGVRCLALYVENLSSVKKFLSACRAASRAKPIVAIKGGRSELGRAIIAKHTGRPAGEDRVYDTAFRRAGVIRVESVAELLASAESLARPARPRGPRLGVVTNSGGIGVLVADSLALRGAAVSELSPALQGRLERYLAPYSGGLDPICIAGDADTNRYVEVLRLCLESGELDTVMVVMVLSGAFSPEAVVERIEGLARRQGVDVIYIWHGNRHQHTAAAQRLRERGHAIFPSMDQAATAHCFAVRYLQNLSNVVAVPPRFEHGLDYAQPAARAWVEQRCSTGACRLGLRETGELLALYGIPVNRAQLVGSEPAAAAAAADLGLPVRLHAAAGSPVFAEELSAWSLNAVGSAWRRCGSGDTPVLVQALPRDVRYEVALGVQTDVEFGPYLYLGPGGRMARPEREAGVILPPLNRLLARRLVDKSRLAERMDLEPAAWERLEELLVRLSQLVVDLPQVQELAINPLTFAADGFRVQDAHLVLADTGVAAPRHLATAPYPNQYEFREQLRDGTPVLIRPIRPEDADSHYEFLHALSNETVYNRFFGHRREVSDEQMVRFTQIDYDREIAIVARAEWEGREVTIGVNRLVYDPHRATYEFAVVVGDAWQGTGIGSLLMEKILEIAADRGIRTVHGMVLATNRKMLALARRLGFVVSGREDGVISIRWELPDAPDEGPAGERS